MPACLPGCLAACLAAFLAARLPAMGLCLLCVQVQILARTELCDADRLGEGVAGPDIRRRLQHLRLRQQRLQGLFSPEVIDASSIDYILSSGVVYKST